MMDQVKIEKIRKAKDAAQRFGFRNTRTMIEGLAEQLWDFEHRTVESAPWKAKRIMSKVHLIEQSMENELSRIDEKDVRTEAKASFYSKIVISAIINVGCGVFFFNLPEIAQMHNMEVAVMLKVGSWAFFGFRLLKEIRDLAIDEENYTIYGVKKNIEQLCCFAEQHVKKAIEDIRDSLDEVPHL